MKIPDSLNKASGSGGATSQARAGKAQEKASVDKPSSDSVTLSLEAQALVHQEPKHHVFDAERIEKIKATIANKQFKVDAGRVTDGLIQTAKDLISAKGE